MNTMLEQTRDEGRSSQEQPALRESRPSSPSRVRRIRPPVEAFGLTHEGLMRATNEDAYLVRPDLGLFAVADGMGGAAAGEVASRMAVDTVCAEIEDSGALQPAHAGPLLLAGGVDVANALIHATAQGDALKRGMGTTFTGMLVCGGRIAIAHVGDSRAYLWRGGRLAQLSEDHSWVAAMVRAGALTPEEAATSPRRNEIQRAVGAEERVQVDTRMIAAEPGDVYLLSSDGLHGLVPDPIIDETLRTERDLTRAAQRLIDCANDVGGDDNITVVLIRIGDWRVEQDGEASSHDAPRA
jgi:serine/threonine protein phosphatase PrpC